MNAASSTSFCRGLPTRSPGRAAHQLPGLCNLHVSCLSGLSIAACVVHQVVHKHHHGQSAQSGLLTMLSAARLLPLQGCTSAARGSVWPLPLFKAHVTSIGQDCLKWAAFGLQPIRLDTTVVELPKMANQQRVSLQFSSEVPGAFVGRIQKSKDTDAILSLARRLSPHLCNHSSSLSTSHRTRPLCPCQWILAWRVHQHRSTLCAGGAFAMDLQWSKCS